MLLNDKCALHTSPVPSSGQSSFLVVKLEEWCIYIYIFLFVYRMMFWFLPQLSQCQFFSIDCICSTTFFWQDFCNILYLCVSIFFLCAIFALVCVFSFRATWQLMFKPLGFWPSFSVHPNPKWKCGTSTAFVFRQVRLILRNSHEFPSWKNLLGRPVGS